MATIIESVTLNFTDLTGAKTGCTTLGSNKFWKGWVEDIGGGLGNFECRWGPTGEKGSDKGSQRNIPLSTALATLRKKAAEKEKKGYTRLQTRTDEEEFQKAAQKGVDLTGSSEVVKKVAEPVKSAFHPEVGRLLGIIYNETSRVVRAGLSSQAGATEENPIGNLSDRQLDLGGEILDQIAEVLRRHFGPESSDNASQTLPLQRNGLPMPEIIDMTNRFMSNVPRAIGRDQRGQANLHRLVLSSYERLEEQRKFLQLLRDAHLTKGVFQAAAHATSTGAKEQVWYDGLGCHIDICEPGSADFTKVATIFNTAQSRKNGNWWRNGKPAVRVARVFKFTRNGSEARFNNYAERVITKPGAVGKIHAWHGTRTENLLGIGKSGLLMPENLPRGVHITGKAFGRGIYHAPVTYNVPKIGGHSTDGTNGAFKSLNYTSATGAYYGAGNTARNAFMFLQDVALGIPEVHKTPCWDKRRPSNFPKVDFIYACAGPGSSLTHDELVTFDEDAQVFRYLIEVEVI